MTARFEVRLAQHVRARRAAVRLTQADLADLSGVSERFVRSLEHGKPTLRLESVLSVLHALGLDLEVTSRRLHKEPAARSENL